jgi:molybdopterin-binding protein
MLDIGMRLLTVREASTRLGVGYSTLKRWVRSGLVRTTRTAGGHHRVSDAEVERLSALENPDVPAGRARSQAPMADVALVELSARNRLAGFVEEVRIDGLLAQVRLRVGDARLTAVITADAVRALKLRRGDDAVAIIKSTEVMIGRTKEAGATDQPHRGQARTGRRTKRGAR